MDTMNKLSIITIAIIIITIVSVILFTFITLSGSCVLLGQCQTKLSASRTTLILRPVGWEVRKYKGWCSAAFSGFRTPQLHLIWIRPAFVLIRVHTIASSSSTTTSSLRPSPLDTHAPWWGSMFKKLSIPFLMSPYPKMPAEEIWRTHPSLHYGLPLQPLVPRARGTSLGPLTSNPIGVPQGSVLSRTLFNLAMAEPHFWRR